MAIADDFTINTTYKTIKHSANSTIYTVNELYTYLLGYFDDETTIRYEIPMSAQTPSEYKFINSWFIDDNSFKYLKSGAITTEGWDASTDNEGIRVLTFTTDPGTIDTDIFKVVTYSGGTPTDTGRLLAYDNTLKKWWVRVDDTGDTFTNTSTAVVITGGTGTGTLTSASVTGESQFSNIYTLGSLVSGTTLDVYQNDLQITPWWGSGHIDIVVKVKEAGIEIDSGNLTVLARTYGSLYDHFVIDASTGRNPVPLAAFTDANNQTISTTVDDYNDIIITFGATSKNLNNGNGPQPYDVIIDCAGRTISQVYEYLKYVTRTGSTDIINGVSGGFYTAVGDIRINYSTETNGPFVETNTIISSSGGSGYIVSVIDNGDTGTLVVRNIHGTFLDTNTLTSSTTTATINGATSSITPLKQAPFGTFAGGKFFGARGVWIENYAGTDANSFVLIDSLNTTQTPPTTVSISVSSLEIGDVISVFKTTGNNKIIDKSYLHSHASNNSSASTSWEVDASTPIPADTPTSGFIRLVKNSTNTEERIAYSSWTGSIFTLSSAHSGGYTASDTAYVPFIDTTATGTSVSIAINYIGDCYIYSIVRHSGIIPFDIKGQVTSTGYSLSAIRTIDSIVGT